MIEKLRGLRLTKAAELAEVEVEETLSDYAFPGKALAAHPRTNNPLEHLLLENRRRTRVSEHSRTEQSVARSLPPPRLRRRRTATAGQPKRYLKVP